MAESGSSKPRSSVRARARRRGTGTNFTARNFQSRRAAVRTVFNS